MRSLLAIIQAFDRDAAGQTTVEWTLLLVAFGIPMYGVIILLTKVLAEHYKMVHFYETLPFP